MEPKQAEGWREIITDLRSQLQQAQEEARVMQLMGIRARRNEKQAQAERDAAIERGKLIWREYLAQVAFGRVLRAVRAKAAEALA